MGGMIDNNWNAYQVTQINFASGGTMQTPFVSARGCTFSTIWNAED